MELITRSRHLRRLPGLIALVVGAGLLAWAFATAEPLPATASPASSAPLVPLPTLLSPIYTDTYEVNNFQSTAYSLNPGFPYASIQCGNEIDDCKERRHSWPRLHSADCRWAVPLQI